MTLPKPLWRQKTREKGRAKARTRRKAEDEVLSQSEFDTFTRARGLQGALSDMLATKCVICMQEVVNL